MMVTALGAGIIAGLSACGRIPQTPADRTPVPTPTTGDGRPPSLDPSPSTAAPPSGPLVPSVIESTPATDTAPSNVRFARPRPSRCPLPGAPITVLPGRGNDVALTVDDGVDSEVVAGYARLCAETGLRLTFFCNGVYRSWTENAPLLRPLVDSGQVVLANHTWSHPALTRLSDAGIVDQLQRNETCLARLYGVSCRPFLRPPYGYYDRRVLRIAREAGYPGIVMWYGNLGDDQVISPAAVLANARRWIDRRRVVIGHANHPAVTYIYDQLVSLVEERRLQPVTLTDVFGDGRPRKDAAA